MSQVLTQAKAFLQEDPDPQTRAELTQILNRLDADDADARAAAEQELEERFTGRLQFGTAGLRGAMGAGTQRMNRVIVQKATFGLGTYLLEQGPKEGFDARKQGVVIGFDGRKNSRQFAEDAASVLCGLGIPVHMTLRPTPTPLCGFAVREVEAAAGIVVTASHNPPEDNGYKVYWANAAQIIPPHDAGIAACIDRAPTLGEIKRPHIFEQIESGLRQPLDSAVEQRYLQAIAGGSLHPGIGADVPLKIVYTAMHGVGNDLVLRSLSQAGFNRVLSVPSQAEPDGSFPTVRFPNPEEEGALDIALAAAQETQADLILANDPDADRIAVCIPASDGNGFTFLSGNDIGILLGDDAVTHADTQGKPKLLVTTLVSSTMLGRMARNVGAVYRETLTGFKWIANAAVEGEANGQSFVLGYEEALGVSVGSIVRDKDGISAAVRVAEMVAYYKKQGKTLFDRLDELSIEHGLSGALQWSVVLPGSEGKAQIAALMETLRREPPADLAGEPVSRRIDLNLSAAQGNEMFEGSEMPPSNVLVFWGEAGTRLIARPSGTEPKIKFYLESTASVSARDELVAARAQLEERLKTLKQELSTRLGL